MLDVVSTTCNYAIHLSSSNLAIIQNFENFTFCKVGSYNTLIQGYILSYILGCDIAVYFCNCNNDSFTCAAE